MPDILGYKFFTGLPFMYKRLVVSLFISLSLFACSESKPPIIVQQESESIVSHGKWILDENGQVMADPQTSGLIAFQGQLVSISDGSALEAQQRKLHFIAPDSPTLTGSSNSFSLSSRVKRSCFNAYLTNAPDLEALAVDPRNPNVLYTVTEDATRTGTFSSRCEKKYEDTGSTDYPTLLVRLERDDSGKVEMTHVRPLQYALSMEVGNFPNDGIEGMAMDDSGTLYLALEKDKAGQPRIFSLVIDDEFWTHTGFAAVEEPSLTLPSFASGAHPINGLTLYTPPQSTDTFLLAAARNDDELWIIDTDNNIDTKRVPLSFVVDTTNACEPYTMDNASIEGLAVIDNTLWLVNDPWKKNYLKNITCDGESAAYQAYAPLLFSLPLKDAWFH